MVTVFVGDDAEPYTVHRDLITATSYFFSKALTGEFQERGGEVRLPDHKSEHFSCYVQWLYEGQFENTKGANSSLSLDLLLLGSYLQDRHFGNGVTDNLINQMKLTGRCPGGLALKLYPDLPAASPIRKLLVDTWVCCSNGD